MGVSGVERDRELAGVASRLGEDLQRRDGRGGESDRGEALRLHPIFGTELRLHDRLPLRSDLGTMRVGQVRDELVEVLVRLLRLLLQLLRRGDGLAHGEIMA
jgi:hypothetical protein